MPFRNVYTYLRLHRDHLGTGAVSASMCFCILYLTICLLTLLGLTEKDHWIEPLVGALISFISAVGCWVLFGRIFAIKNQLASAFKLNQEGRYEDAAHHARAAWKHGQLLTTSDPWRALILEQLTRIQSSLGNYDDAESFGQLWVSAEEHAWGSEHSRTLHAMETVAGIYVQIARYAQAKSLLEKAVSIRELRQGDELAELAKCLNALGEFWLHIDRDALAEPYFRRAFGHITDNTHLDDVDMPQWEKLRIVINLSSVALQRNQLAEAEWRILAALEAAQKYHPSDSWPVVICLHQLAKLRHAQGCQPEAEETARRAMAILQKLTGSNRVNLHGVLHLLGDILNVQARLEEAEAFYRESLQWCKDYLAPEDMAIARFLDRYADFLSSLGRREEAHMHERWAEQIRKVHSALLAS